MRFQVPQFIEVEDKIFGPLTLRQFIYLAGAAGIVVILWALLPRFIAFLLGAPIAALGVALAFVKINNRPFINVLESAFSYALTNRLYIWKKREQTQPSQMRRRKAPSQKTLVNVPTLSQNRLKDLTRSLDIKENIQSERDQLK